MAELSLVRCPDNPLAIAKADQLLLDTVTGANGFLGTTLAIAILESGGDVVCLDLPEETTATNWSKCPL